MFARENRLLHLVQDAMQGSTLIQKLTNRQGGHVWAFNTKAAA
jgi:hypothetical protein